MITTVNNVTTTTVPQNDRERVLQMAADCVCGKRHEDYGKPENNFETIANMWSAYLDVDISAVDVASMMALLKIARIKAGGTVDCFVDLAGYAACGGEIFMHQNPQRN